MLRSLERLQISKTCDNIATALKTYYADEEVAASATATTVTVTLSKTELGTGTTVDTAVKDAGLTKAKIKGTKWTNDTITVVYNKQMELLHILEILHITMQIKIIQKGPKTTTP